MIFESDCKKAINIFNNRAFHFDPYNWIREMNWWRQQFTEVKFNWIERQGNKVADSLAKQDFQTHENFVFHYYVPRCISSLLHHDYVFSN